MWETQVRSLVQEDPLGKEMATHSNILAWRTHGRRSLVGYSPQGRRVGHDWATSLSLPSLKRHFKQQGLENLFFLWFIYLIWLHRDFLAACGLSLVLVHRPHTGLVVPLSMWDLPEPGIESMSPALSGRFLTTGPPGKFLENLHVYTWVSMSHVCFLFFMSENCRHAESSCTCQ